MADPEGFYLVPTVDAPSGRFMPSNRRDAEAARLMALGWHEDEVTERLGYSDPTATIRGAKRAMAEVLRFARDEQRLMELRGLNEIEVRLWRLLDTDIVLVQHGKVVVIDGAPTKDHRFALEVMDRLMHVKAQRCRLLGLDAPTRTEVFTIDSVEAEIARLTHELGD